ncbi:MAG: shikimate kinase [Oscillibacter sp.]|jgi:shikimate dehydrogenase|nr:shikimate kinase [uncultured Oscillibacter sp.]MCI8812267.1 shikimate kinase [Oscillibacter sp.]
MGEKLYGLLGRKLGHSWSVPIHKALGCADYRLIELEPEQLREFLRRENIGGLNVTIPYKQDVMQFCDVIDPAAEAIGSVNTLVRRDGRLYGYNTDIDGFLYMLRRAKISLAGRKAVILGSGGASLTAQAAARLEGAREIAVLSHSDLDNCEFINHRDAEALVNTTPVGMWPDLDGLSMNLRNLPSITDVVDVIYNPGRTSLLLQAEEMDGEPRHHRHFRWTGGLPMLVQQAKRAEELFFGRSIPDEEAEKLIAQLWRDQTNLVLIGMPGSGKTTVGRELARLSGKSFVDVDEEIARAAGKPIPEIFVQEGEEAFRMLEKRILKEVCAQSGRVISTGGGVVLHMENWKTMRRTGWVYRLERRLEDLATEGRPLSKSGNLAKMEQIRGPLYRAAADAAVQNDISPEETAAKIWRDFCENSGH